MGSGPGPGLGPSGVTGTGILFRGIYDATGRRYRRPRSQSQSQPQSESIPGSDWDWERDWDWEPTTQTAIRSGERSRMSDWIELFNGRDLEGWTARRQHAWRVAGGVRVREDDPKQFVIEPGGGIMVNGDTG